MTEQRRVAELALVALVAGQGSELPAEPCKEWHRVHPAPWWGLWFDRWAVGCLWGAGRPSSHHQCHLMTWRCNLTHDGCLHQCTIHSDFLRLLLTIRPSQHTARVRRTVTCALGTDAPSPGSPETEVESRAVALGKFSVHQRHAQPSVDEIVSGKDGRPAGSGGHEA